MYMGIMIWCYKTNMDILLNRQYGRNFMMST